MYFHSIKYLIFVFSGIFFVFFQKPYARPAVFLQDHDGVGQNNVGQGGEIYVTISLRPPHQPPHPQDRGLYTAVPFLSWLVVAGVVAVLFLVAKVVVVVLDFFDLSLEM